MNDSSEEVIISNETSKNLTNISLKEMLEWLENNGITPLPLRPKSRIPIKRIQGIKGIEDDSFLKYTLERIKIINRFLFTEKPAHRPKRLVFID